MKNFNHLYPQSLHYLPTSSNLTRNNLHLTIEHLCRKVKVVLRPSTVKLGNQDPHIQEPAFVEVKLSILKQSQPVESQLHYPGRRDGGKNPSFKNPIYPNRLILWKLKHNKGHRNR
jgi:hypothetical protein